MAAVAASVPPPPPWIPEDDLLLKNAVEAGASLEALAKGAVRFSRKFTVRELRDRWHSLLYDPDISAEASARMFEYELSAASGSSVTSKLNKSGVSKETVQISAKRKVESVRRMYYAMRKRFCSRNCDNFGLDSNQSHFNASVEDNGDGNGIRLSGMNDVYSRSMLEEKCGVDLVGGSSAMSEFCFADISDSLLNIPSEDGMLFVDGEGKDAMDKSCYDGIGSLLVSSPNGVHDDMLVVKEPETLVSETSLGVLGGGCLGDDQHIHFCSEVNAPSSTSAPNALSAECSDVKMDCILNTEDPEIPCNDDISFVKESNSVIKATSKYAGFPSSSCKMKKEDNPLISSRMAGFDMLPVTSPSHQLVSCGVKCESSDGTSLAVASRHTSNAHGDPTQCRSSQASLTSATVRVLKPESLHECNAMDWPLHPKAISEPEAEPSTLNEEESESDDDVPCFSDIEAMILEMDLCQDDSDSCFNREVSKYQNEDAKRTIIRLEQCALSSMQRAIASRGALAILYGRHLKHYIKETKVMLGRATDDMDVDIDLGREGPANKISRRQALIKMEGDGSFFLKNLGKSSIFLNGKEVATGQSMGLSSSSLIEIRGMEFVFEMNPKSVRRYLVNAAKKHRADNSKFEWSE